MAKGEFNTPQCYCRLRWFKVIEDGKIYKITMKNRCKYYHCKEDNPLAIWMEKMVRDGFAYALDPLSDEVSDYLKKIYG